MAGKEKRVGIILENLAEMDVPFPEQIKDKLEVLKNKSGDK